MKYLDICSEIIFHVLIWKPCASQSFLVLRLLKKVAISLGKMYGKKPGSLAQQYLNFKYFKTYVTRRLLLSFQGRWTMNPTGHWWEQSQTSLHFIFILLLSHEVKIQVVQNAQHGNLHSPVPSLRTIYIQFVARLESGALCSLCLLKFYISVVMFFLVHFKWVSTSLIVWLPKVSNEEFDFRARCRLIGKVIIVYEICKDPFLQDWVKS